MRAAYLQFLPNDRLEALKNRQFKTIVTLPARRGSIVDRNGRDLAMSAAVYSLYADPKILENKKSIAKKLAKELGVSSESIYAKLKDNSKRFVWIQRFLEEDKMNRIKEMDERGLAFVEEWKRVYPNESILAHTLGFLGVEGQGLDGLELQYDHLLKGNTKKISVRRDARGRPLVNDGLMFAENPDGAEIKLTVDSDLQYVLESELSHAVSEFDADSAVAIVLDAQTSAIRAISSYPSFDVNSAMKAAQSVRRNRVITDAFEPGSTMKTFVIATALREKIAKPNSKYFAENGKFKVGDKIIREAEASHAFGSLTVTEILALSSNIGTTKIAFQMGSEKLRQGLLDFGFGSRQGVELPGEAKGTVQALPWRPHLLSNISFGQGISATPLQVANAFATIANGGVLHTPYLVQSIRDPDSGEVQEFKTKEVRRVLSAEDAASMRMMLTAVTNPGGTGMNARVNGFIVAGKTGTAQKVNPNSRGYIPGGYISSFGGFIPAQDPKFVIYVAVDHPKKAYYGAQVAAPIFSRVASYAVRKEGLAPSLLTEENLSIQRKPSGSLMTVSSTGMMTANELKQMASEKTMTVVPDLNGLSVREVMRRVNGTDLQLKVTGQGLVSEIYPAVGSALGPEKKITVILR